MGVLRTFRTLREQMLGTTVAHKRLFLDTLQLYLLAHEQDDRAMALEIWCESPWKILGPEGVIADSKALDLDDSAPDAIIERHLADFDKVQRSLSRAADVLVGRRVEDIYVDRKTQGLRLLLDEGLAVHSLLPTEKDAEQWLLRGPGGKPEVGGCEEGIYLVYRDADGLRREEPDTPP